MTLRACIKSFRLRTLPQSLSGIVLGIGLGAHHCGCEIGSGAFPVCTAIFLILTAVALQILSNLANELGDTLHGTDVAGKRLGAHYSLMDGEMTVVEMMNLVGLVGGIACIFGLLMVWFSFFSMGMGGVGFAVLGLGLVTIVAALRYTLGKHPYGYSGFGDLFVFIFFGLVATLGSAYIISHTFSAYWLMPACAVGLFSTGVLNVNNIRDMDTDAATRKTVAIRLGLKGARIYQTALIVVGVALMLVYTSLTSFTTVGYASPIAGFDPIAGAACAKGLYAASSGLNETGYCVCGGMFGCRTVGDVILRWSYLLIIPLFEVHLCGIWMRERKNLDPMLPLLVISTFLASILFTIGL